MILDFSLLQYWISMAHLARYTTAIAQSWKESIIETCLMLMILIMAK
jgi:hypothetical protein